MLQSNVNSSQHSPHKIITQTQYFTPSPHKKCYPNSNSTNLNTPDPIQSLSPQEFFQNFHSIIKVTYSDNQINLFSQDKQVKRNLLQQFENQRTLKKQILGLFVQKKLQEIEECEQLKPWIVESEYSQEQCEQLVQVQRQEQRYIQQLGQIQLGQEKGIQQSYKQYKLDCKQKEIDQFQFIQHPFFTQRKQNTQDHTLELSFKYLAIDQFQYFTPINKPTQ